MVAINTPAVVRHYDDGPGWPNATREKERAFRRGFVEEARRVIRQWAHPPEDLMGEPRVVATKLSELQANRRFDPIKEIEAARMLRLRVRERYTVYGAAYGPGCAGQRTHHLGYRSGHEVPAARLRGRHHALEYVVEPWQHASTDHVDIFHPMILCPWLRAVEDWAKGPIRADAPLPPPRPMEIEGSETILSESGKYASPENLPSEPSPRRGLQLIRADMIEMRPPDWLLCGMLERDTFALVFGDPGSGKSFLAIDWACRIATGTPWRGHGVQAAPVVYVAGEGHNGLGRRLQAWQRRNAQGLEDAPLYIAPAVALTDPGQLVGLVKAIAARTEAPAVIVIDTLARCFGGGDENATKDMSAFVSACDALRRHYRCAVLVIHHAGHGDKSRARGAIALKAALDAEYRVEKTDGNRLVLTATKMKDAETPSPLALELVTVDLPGMVDEYGNQVTSAAIEVLDADTGAIVAQAMATRSPKRGKWRWAGAREGLARRV